MCELTTSQKHIITELNNSRGEYKPAFMQIRIHDSYDGNIDELDIPTLGTIVHEYIHFLQNVSTPWGLYDSMVRYNIMAETYAFVENATSTITLPLDIDYSPELANKIAIVKCGMGYCPLADTRRNDFKIDVNERICIHRKYKQLNNRILPVITLDICFTDGSKQAITLGANIIKESMAALYQMLIDETATHERYDLPYNLVKIIAEQHFSAIASDYNTPRFSDRHNYGGMTNNRYICKKEENQNGKTIEIYSFFQGESRRGSAQGNGATGVAGQEIWRGTLENYRMEERVA